MNLVEAKSIVAMAIARGWAKRPQQTTTLSDKEYHRQYAKEMRDAYVAMGLTSRGTPRKNKLHGNRQSRPTNLAKCVA